MTTGSLAYRKNVAAIQDGRPPDKYRRILPFITGRRILEIGAAEGVLSLLVADRDPAAHVTALERQPDRHAAACALQARWRSLGRRVDGCAMVCGDIVTELDRLDGVDTLVAIRTIYHLRDAIGTVFAAAADRGVTHVVLGGNANRAKRFADGVPDDSLGPFNVYAGIDGMRAVLEGAGYHVDHVITNGDPIVTGHR